MNRERTLVIATAVVTATACAAFYLSRRSSLAVVEAAIAEKQAILAGTGASDAPSARRHRTRDARPEPMTVAQALEKAEAIHANFTGPETSRTAYLKAAGDLLARLRDLPAADLLALADALNLPAGARGNQAILKNSILRLAAEKDLQAVLARADVAADFGLARELLDKLAQTDPAAAKRWEEANGFKYEGMRPMTLPLGSPTRFGIYRCPDLSPDQIDQTAATLGTLTDAGQKNKILGQIMQSAAFFSGIDGMRDIAAKHQIPREDMAAFLVSREGRSALEGINPGKSLAWMGEILNDGQKQKQIPAAIGSWAEDDYNAAATYLGQMPASPLKDKSVSMFSTKVTTIDPAAAAQWALEISDPNQRQSAISHVMSHWRSSDSAAAGKWLQENGLSAPAN